MPEALLDEAECLEVAVALARQAGDVIRDALVKASWCSSDACARSYDLKRENDHVTEVDVACERIILDGLRARYPSHRFIGEESTGLAEVPALTDEPTWMVDPLDGTTNFVHGFGHCAVSIGLCVFKTPVVGVVCDAMRQEIFTARRGRGLFMDNRRVRASPEQTLAQSIMSIEWPSSGADRRARRGNSTSSSGVDGGSDDSSATARQLALLGRLLDTPHSLSALRGTGSCVLDLAWVACGRLNLTYRGHVGCKCWDVCAGALLVAEGGGVLSGPTGADVFDLMSGRFVAAGSPTLLREFQGCLAGAESTSDELGDCKPNSRL